jgi:imidazole glycerol-phosphate synthase subunit HisF
MLKHRVIPCLLLKNSGLVKTRKFASPRYIGDPINAIRIFNEKEVDELIVLDIEASKAFKEPNYEIVEQLAGECFMPLCYGGGISTVEQVQHLLSLGVEKVSIQTSCLKNIDLISRISSRYGNQSVVVSIDVKKNLLGQYRLYSSATGKTLNENWIDFLKSAIDAGAGEILINAVDKDGTMSGMDLTLIENASSVCSAPLIALGGVGSLDDIQAAVKAGASAVSAGSFFVFYGPHEAVLITYPKYDELVNLLGNNND